jgi:hypothetical protein
LLEDLNGGTDDGETIISPGEGAVLEN